MYQSILIAVDLSQISEMAVKKAFDIGKANQSRAHICYVININGMLSQTSYAYAINLDFQEQMVKPIKQEFHRFCESHQMDSQHCHFIEGSPKEEILKFAEKIKADLIVVGGHSHSWIGMLGSVANAVANQAKCDVLIVNS
jgi:nucleotide-binding universal stress UspA family protein